MIGCVILNYNDSDNTIKLVNYISGYDCLDKIVIIDGKSSDNSVKEIKKILNDRVVLLILDKNGGYGYGNNAGIRYLQSLGINHVIVANPDVRFTEGIINSALKLFKENSNVVSISPRVKGHCPAYREVNPLLDVFQESFIIRKILKPREYPVAYFSGKLECMVDTLPGSLVFFDVKKFIECGLYDENVFLYHEEIILSSKFKKKNYKCILDMKHEYDHFHSITIDKNIKSATKRKRIVINSHRYYLKEYRKSYVACLLLFLLSPLFIFEDIIWVKIKGVLSRMHYID